jgi:hypothetical protein
VIDRHVPLAAPGFVVSGEYGDALQKRGFAGAVSPTMIVIERSKSSSKSSWRNGRQNG